MTAFRINRDIKIALTSVVIFTIVNLIGGIVNDAKHYTLGSKDVISVIPFHFIFAGFFLLSCGPKIKIRKTIRLPLLRMIFWLYISIDLFANNGARSMCTGDFIDACIPSFCFFANTIVIEFSHLAWQIKLYGILIIGVTLYQIAVLEISTLIVHKFEKWKMSVSY